MCVEKHAQFNGGVHRKYEPQAHGDAESKCKDSCRPLGVVLGFILLDSCHYYRREHHGNKYEGDKNIIHIRNSLQEKGLLDRYLLIVTFSNVLAMSHNRHIGSLLTR
jgi:hypothetical protein